MPVKPVGQVQLKLSSVSVQLPAFSHGASSHAKPAPAANTDPCSVSKIMPTVNTAIHHMILYNMAIVLNQHTLLLL